MFDKIYELKLASHQTKYLSSCTLMNIKTTGVLFHNIDLSEITDTACCLIFFCFMKTKLLLIYWTKIES